MADGWIGSSSALFLPAHQRMKMPVCMTLFHLRPIVPSRSVGNGLLKRNLSIGGKIDRLSLLRSEDALRSSGLLRPQKLFGWRRSERFFIFSPDAQSMPALAIVRLASASITLLLEQQVERHGTAKKLRLLAGPNGQTSHLLSRRRILHLGLLALAATSNHYFA